MGAQIRKKTTLMCLLRKYFVFKKRDEKLDKTVFYGKAGIL